MYDNWIQNINKIMRDRLQHQSHINFSRRIFSFNNIKI